MIRMKEITKKEFSEYQWTRVGKNEFVRGFKLTSPPDDEYEYVDVTTYANCEQKWERAVVMVND